MKELIRECREISSNEVYKHPSNRFFVVEREFEIKDFDDQTLKIKRIEFERGDSVAALVYNKTKDSFLLVEQFRAPSNKHGKPFTPELVAGMCDGSSNYWAVMLNELQQEVGYMPIEMAYITSLMPSMGGCTEMIHLFFITVDDDSKISEGGGFPGENEFISYDWFSLDSIESAFKRGDYVDMKLFTMIQWAKNKIYQKY